MTNYKTTLVAGLNTILPTYYEQFCDSTIQKPVITYTEYNNYSQAEGDTVRYSNIQFMVKLWADDLSSIDTYRAQIDSKMKELGFKRLSYSELVANRQICALMLFEGLAKD